MLAHGEFVAGPAIRMSLLSLSVRRVGLIAGNTMREAVRQRLFNFIALLAVGVVVSAQWLQEFNFGSSELKFIADLGFGAMAVFGSALTIVATAQLFFSELEHRTVFTLLAKPLRRSEFVIGKFFGIAFVSMSFCGLLTLVLAVVLWNRETALMTKYPEAFDQGRAVDYISVMTAGFAQWLKLALLSALTLLVASFARTQLFTTAAGFMILVICHLRFLAENSAQRGDSTAGRLVAKALAVGMPDFQLFDLSDSLAAGDATLWTHLLRLTVYAIGYVAAICLLAVFSFRRREI